MKTHILSCLVALCSANLYAMRFPYYQTLQETIYEDSFICNKKEITIYRKGMFTVTRSKESKSSYGPPTYTYTFCDLNLETIESTQSPINPFILFDHLAQEYKQQQKIKSQKKQIYL